MRESALLFHMSVILEDEATRSVAEYNDFRLASASGGERTQGEVTVDINETSKRIAH